MRRFLYIAALAAAACALQQPSDAVDRAVLEAAVADPHFAEWTRCGSTQYSLQPVTAPPAYENGEPFFFTRTELGSELPTAVSPELLNSLRERNKVRTSLPKLSLRAPEGLRASVWLSRPGYDRTRNAAVAVTRSTAGGCAAAGYIVVLRHSGGKWFVQDRAAEWVE